MTILSIAKESGCQQIRDELIIYELEGKNQSRVQITKWLIFHHFMRAHMPIYLHLRVSLCKATRIGM